MNTTFLSKAEVLVNTSRHKDAISFIQRALAIDPDDGYAHGLLSLCYSNQELYKEAVEEGELAISLSAEDAFGYYVTGLAYFKKEKYGKAKDYLMEAITYAPENGGLYHIYGFCLLCLGHKKECQEVINQGLSLEPDNADLLHLQSLLYNENGDIDKAKSFAKRSLKEDPDDSHNLSWKGWISLQEYRYNEAEMEFVSALQKDPLNEEAKEGLFEIYKLKSMVFNFFLKNSFRTFFYEIKWYYLFILIILIKTLPIWLFLLSIYLLVGWYLSVLFNTVLRFGRVTKYLISKRQIIQSNVFAGLNLVALSFLIAGQITDSDLCYKLMWVSVALIFIGIGTFQLEFEKSRYESAFLSCFLLGAIYLSLDYSVFATFLTSLIAICIYGLGWSLRIKIV